MESRVHGIEKRLDNIDHHVEKLVTAMEHLVKLDERITHHTHVVEDHEMRIRAIEKITANELMIRIMLIVTGAAFGALIKAFI